MWLIMPVVSYLIRQCTRNFTTATRTRGAPDIARFGRLTSPAKTSVERAVSVGAMSGRSAVSVGWVS